MASEAPGEAAWQSDMDSIMEALAGPPSAPPPVPRPSLQPEGPGSSRQPGGPNPRASRLPRSAREIPPPPEETPTRPSLDALFAGGIQHMSSLQPALPLPSPLPDAFDRERALDDPIAEAERLQILYRELSYLDTASVAIKNAYANIAQINEILTPFREGPWNRRRERVWELGMGLLRSQSYSATGTPSVEEIRRVKQEEHEQELQFDSSESGGDGEGDVEMEYS